VIVFVLTVGPLILALSAWIGMHGGA